MKIAAKLVAILLMFALPDGSAAQTTRPFWNERAIQFMWAPAFDLKPIEGAASYRFVIHCESGKTLTFDAKEPTAALSPVWDDVPAGRAELKVEALESDGKVIAQAGERSFHRAATYRGPYGKAVLPYGQSGAVALKSVIDEPFVRSWKATGKPDPQYPLYRYASKVIGSLMTAASLYARQEPRPSDADEAIAIGRAAGDFLISISMPAGSPLEYFPPTYHDAKPTERENDFWTMLMSPAEAGEGFLDLYEATRDEKYLEAAKRIARTYAKTQAASGTWPLKVDNRTGEAIAPIDLIPAMPIEFLDRLVSVHQFEQARPTLDRAVDWIMDHPVRTMNWQAQFDDAKLRGAYQNLGKHEACTFAMYLFVHRQQVDVGEELLRWAEDQFVVWENPPDLKVRGENMKPANWIMPCSLEQYAMFEPISGSSAFMIMTYCRAYEATAKKLYLEKAQSLANALTQAQAMHGGKYPTRMVKHDQAYWINSTVNCVRAMRLLAAQK